jgi:hypothetical protein
LTGDPGECIVKPARRGPGAASTTEADQVAASVSRRRSGRWNKAAVRLVPHVVTARERDLEPKQGGSMNAYA